MVDVKLDTTGDLELSDGHLVVATGGELVAQRLRLGLGMRRGEWFLDTTFGFFATDDFLARPNVGAMLTAALRAFVAETSGVDKIESLEASHDAATRSLTISFGVLHDNELIEGSVTL